MLCFTYFDFFLLIVEETDIFVIRSRFDRAFALIEESKNSVGRDRISQGLFTKISEDLKPMAKKISGKL